METFIVLMSIEYDRARKDCELIVNSVYSNEDGTPIRAHQVRDLVIIETGVKEEFLEVEPITDFMDRFNNEEINPDNYFMTYVYSK